MRLLILLPILALTLPAADSRQAAEKAVRAAVESFNQAARSGDPDILSRLLSDDLIYVHSNARTENKAECIAGLLRDKVDFQMKPGSVFHVHGDTVVVHARTVAHLMQQGKPVQIPLDMLQVWVKSGDTWRMVARHTTRLP